MVPILTAAHAPRHHSDRSVLRGFYQRRSAWTLWPGDMPASWATEDLSPLHRESNVRGKRLRNLGPRPRFIAIDPGRRFWRVGEGECWLDTCNREAERQSVGGVGTRLARRKPTQRASIRSPQHRTTRAERKHMPHIFLDAIADASFRALSPKAHFLLVIPADETSTRLWGQEEQLRRLPILPDLHGNARYWFWLFWRSPRDSDAIARR